MDRTLKILALLILVSLLTNCKLFAGEPVMRMGADIDTVYLDCDIQDFANPFLLKATTSDQVIFKSINGEFSILIRNADKFFQDVSQNVKISLGNGQKSETYTIKSDLLIDSEIKYEVYCITGGRFADSPPRIIIVPKDEQ